MSQPVVDLAFPLRGKALPVDHGYALYSACCKVVPEIHGDRDMGIFPVQGAYSGGENLLLNRTSKLTLRIQADRVGQFLPLAGKSLEVGGCPLALGAPNLQNLRPTASLLARTVTIKGFEEEGPFLEALERQLLPVAPEARATIIKRRTVRIAGKQVVGFKVQVEGLAAEESIALQEKGLGGRRRFGCGLLVPVHR
jgi:CRISPR-associated protein Cas6